MTTVYLVLDGDAYLCPMEGDVGRTPSKDQAGECLSYEDAVALGDEHADPGYKIIRVER